MYKNASLLLVIFSGYAVAGNNIFILKNETHSTLEVTLKLGSHKQRYYLNGVGSEQCSLQVNALNTLCLYKIKAEDLSDHARFIEKKQIVSMYACSGKVITFVDEKGALAIKLKDLLTVNVSPLGSSASILSGSDEGAL